MLVHLTNVAIQKQGVTQSSVELICFLNFKWIKLELCVQDDYNPHHGGKWSVDDLLFYIASLRGSDAADLLWQEICWVIGKLMSGRINYNIFIIPRRKE